MPSAEQQARLDAFFAEADDILENWNGGADSASWAADGSHQVDGDIGGDYYAQDIGRRLGRFPTGPAPRHRAPHLHPEMRRDGGIRGMTPQMFVNAWGIEVAYTDPTPPRVTDVTSAT